MKSPRNRFSQLIRFFYRADIAMLSVVLLLSCSPIHPDRAELVVGKTSGEEIDINVALAVSPAEKRSGLSQIDAIGYNEGTLLIYGADKYISLTMRGARNDISAAFLDSSGVIKEIYNMIIDPNVVYRSSEKNRYALQMAIGWFDDNGVNAGDQIILPPEIRKIKPLL